MRRLLLLAAMTAGGVLVPMGTARADGERQKMPNYQYSIHECLGPHSTSVTWPSVVPPGWYTDTYRHKWYLPWYAYYNYSMGPYANWMVGGGYAGYASHGPAGIYYSHKPPTEPYVGAWYYRAQEREGQRAQSAGQPQPATTGTPEPMPKKDEKKDEKKTEKGGQVSITLPADAKLLFNGVVATGSGSTRTFATPPLVVGQVYKYDLTAEVVRNGRTERATGIVIVRAGETARVVLTPIPVPDVVTTASK